MYDVPFTNKTRYYVFSFQGAVVGIDDWSGRETRFGGQQQLYELRAASA